MFINKMSFIYKHIFNNEKELILTINNIDDLIPPIDNNYKDKFIYCTTTQSIYIYNKEFENNNLLILFFKVIGGTTSDNHINNFIISNLTQYYKKIEMDILLGNLTTTIQQNDIKHANDLTQLLNVVVNLQNQLLNHLNN